MKKIFFMTILILFSGTSFAEQEINIAYLNVPPFVIYNTEEDKLTGGALYEFLEQHIRPKIGVKFVWARSPSSIPRQLQSLEDKSVDAIALLSYTPERAQKYAFTAIPFFVSSPAIAVLKSNKIEKVDKVEDILSLKIGYGRDTYLSPFMRDKRINFDLITSSNFNQQNINKLMISVIDAVYAPDVASLLAAIKKLNYEDDIKVIKLPDEKSANHVVFSKDLESVAERYNEAFDQIDGEKVFLQILSKYVDISKL
jgi:polar amino acid transport system substrate-binding protein